MVIAARRHERAITPLRATAFNGMAKSIIRAAEHPRTPPGVTTAVPGHR